MLLRDGESYRLLQSPPKDNNNRLSIEGRSEFALILITGRVSRVKAVVFTFIAFFHVRTQPHSVRTSARVLWGMWRDLGCRKTQVFTASIWQRTEFTSIWSYI